MGLLRADLQALGNLLTRREGHRILVTHAVSLGVLGAISALMAQSLLLRPEVGEALTEGDPEENLLALLGAALGPTVLVAIWFGFGMAWRALFESPELPLWIQSPAPRTRPPVQILLRVLLSSWLWAMALCGPFVATALHQLGAGNRGLLLLPVTVLLCLLPPVVLVMALQITAQRFLPGPTAQGLATVLAALASLMFAAFLTAGAFAPDDVRADQLADLIRNRPSLLSAATGTAAEVLAAGSGRPLSPGTLATATGWFLGPIVLFLLVARWYPRAVQNASQARRRRPRRQVTLPAVAHAAIRKKELAQIVQQPGHLLGQVLFAVLILVFAMNGLLVQPLLDTEWLPPSARHCGAMLGLWFLATLMALNGHMGRVAMQDGNQWPLYLHSPTPPGAILRGKLEAIFLMLLWPLLVVALVGAQVLGASWPATGVFLLAGLFGNAIATGVVAGIGSFPFLLHPDESGRLAQGTRPLLASLLLIFLFEFAMVPAVAGCFLLAELLRREVLGLGGAAGVLVLGFALLALCLGSAGGLLARRNFARLLRPR